MLKARSDSYFFRWLPALCLLPQLAFTHNTPYTELRFDRITVGDGLSNGAVNAITQDAEGFMWFGTEDGLNRYDGHRFVIYRPEPNNPNSLASGNFGSVLQDSRGQMWLGTWGGGLDRLDPNTGVFTHYGVGAGNQPGFRGRNIEFVFEDTRGDIWIGTERSGLNRYRWREDSFEHFSLSMPGEEGEAINAAKAIEEDADGNLYVGTDFALLRFDATSETFRPIALPASLRDTRPRIRSLERDRSDGLWVGTRGDGLFRLDTESGVWREYHHQPGRENGLSENAIARVFIDSVGTVWIATYNSGLDRLNPATGEFRNYDYAPEETGESISFRRIDAIFEDRGGILWFGTRGGGINKLPVRSRGFKSYRYAPGEKHGLPHTTVRSLAQELRDGQETIWVGTDGGGLVAYDPQQGHFDAIAPQPGRPGALQDGRIWSVLADSKERIWAGTYSAGLFVANSSSQAPRFSQLVHEPGRPDSLSGNRVQVLLEATNGDIWIGTRRGLNRLQSPAGGGRFQRFLSGSDGQQSLPAAEITALLESEDGALWVGTRTAGLSLLNPATGELKRFPVAPGTPGALTSAHVTSLARDLRGRLWVGTDAGGLHRIDTATGVFERQERATLASGLRINSILVDDSGRLWLGTGRGLVRFDPDNQEVLAFGLSDGLVTQSYMRRAAVTGRDGEMYLGGLRGMVSFKPDEIYKNTRPPPLVFTRVTRFDTGEELLSPSLASGTETLELDHDGAFIRFEYAALDFRNPIANRYSHFLEGVDATWVETGNDSSAIYSGLPPGNYVFRVRAANNDGVWNDEGISIGLVVSPPYWQTWWFRLGLLTLVALLIYGFHLVRTGAIRAQNLKLELLNAKLLDQITERTRMENEREALILELEERNAEMEKFTYTVSHDLKSPLITIKGFLGLLRQDQAQDRPDRVRKDISKIESATTRMNQLLDELLQFSRAGKKRTTAEFVAMDEVVQEALGLVRGELERRAVQVQVVASLPTVYAERIRLIEVMQNLLSNAARFMGDQLHPRVEIGVREDHKGPVFYVKDNGIGIKKKHRELIFGLFERLNADTPGTGIGLALVRRIVENHGGEVWVESDGPGKGTTFCFTLRLAPEIDEQDPSAAA